MRFAFLLALLFAPQFASASPQRCIGLAQARYFACQEKCEGKEAAAKATCIRYCAVDYYSAQRECQRQSLAFVDTAFTRKANEDPNCKFIVSKEDGRSRLLCMIDGRIWDSWGQCKTYCR